MNYNLNFKSKEKENKSKKPVLNYRNNLLNNKTLFRNFLVVIKCLVIKSFLIL